MTVKSLPALAAALTIALAACSQDPSGAVQAQAQAAEEPAAPVSSIRDVTVAEADALIASEAPVTIIDVRTPGEFAEGHIEGAANINLRDPDFAEQIAALDPEGSYVLHCKSGARSARALEIMKEQGFADIAHMSEGFDGWQASGKAVVQP